MPTVPELAYALITVFEGERLTSYQDPGGVWTIGLGHTGVQAGPGKTITHGEAVALFVKDAVPLFAAFKGSILYQVALVSFAYNVGLHTALNSTIEQMSNFVHDRHGNVLPGLVARRRLESLLAGM